MMTAKELANHLDGSEYPFEVPDALAIAAKESGLVVVCGGSDDLMEFYGAFRDEVGAYKGTIVEIGPEGLVPDFENIDNRDKDALRAFFAVEGKGRKIVAVWSKEGYSWTFKTAIPHETFEVMEDGDKYCRGIVFQLSDCASAGDRAL